MTHGRIIAIQEKSVFLKNLHGDHEVPLNSECIREASPKIGDIAEAQSPSTLKILTRTLSPTPTQWQDWVLNPKRLQGTKIRAQVEAGIREFFTKQGFFETPTPLLVPCPGMEIHIRTYEVKQGGYLPTSPEFAMKRLLVGGLEKIFQMTKSFRYEPLSTTHHPEFTMLEWYRAYSDYEQIMKDTEKLVEFLAVKILGKPEIEFQGQKISVKTPWPRFKIRDLFSNLGVDLVKSSSVESLHVECKRLGLQTSPQDTWDDLYFRIWLNLIEPKLPQDQAVIVMRYPPSQSALAVVDQDADGSRWAKRFEFYAGGLELGNAFEELTNAKEQRARFTKDMDEREKIYGAEFPKTPPDEEFLQALEQGMPPSGGIAVGVDRLIMLLANESDIQNTIWLKSYSKDC